MCQSCWGLWRTLIWSKHFRHTFNQKWHQHSPKMCSNCPDNTHQPITSHRIFLPHQKNLQRTFLVKDFSSKSISCKRRGRMFWRSHRPKPRITVVASKHWRNVTQHLWNSTQSQRKLKQGYNRKCNNEKAYLHFSKLLWTHSHSYFLGISVK